MHKLFFVARVEVYRNVVIVMVVNNVEFLFANYSHCAQHVQSIVNASLDILEINSLASLYQKISDRYLRKCAIFKLTTQNFLYISSISLAIYVPVTIGRSLTFLRTDLLRNTSFLSFFFSSG